MRMLRILPLLGLLALAACGEGREATEATRPVGVEAAAPLEGVTGRRYTATLEPREQVSVAFRVGGYVEDILTVPVSSSVQNATRVQTGAAVPGADARTPAAKTGQARRVDAERGDAVRRGQVLARLRTADYQGRVAAARGALDETVAARRQAGIDLERLTVLLRDKAVAQSEYDKAREKADATTAREEAARGRLAEALDQLRDTALICPLDGVITMRDVERGALATPGKVAYVVADLSRMKAVFGVPDSLVDAMHPGASLDVRVASVDVVRTGRVTAVSPAADKRSRVFDVEVTLDNPDGLLREGMSAVVVLGAGSAGPSPAVPLSAVVRPAGKADGYAVFVVGDEGGTAVAQQRTVRLGTVEGSRVEIVEGLEAGERVVVLGATLLHDGERVRVLPGGVEAAAR